MIWSDPNQPPRRTRLYRTAGHEARLFGVCGGIAKYFGVSSFWIRFAFFAGGVFFTFPTVMSYLLLTFILSREPENLYDSREEAEFWQSVHREPVQTLSSLARRFQTLETRLRRIEAQVTSPAFRMDRDLRGSGRN